MLIKSVAALLAIGLGPVLVSAQKPFPVVGASAVGDGEVPIRRNVNDMYSEGGPQWDVYIQALRALQARNASDPRSFFQVAGIHGVPYIEWNGGGKRNNQGWGGYCPHGEAIFVHWHRPLVLLYEQLLVDEAKTIARRYPGEHRDQYLAAAERLRSPYWDWSANSDVPPCTVPQTMNIKIPNGDGLREVQVVNPLRVYNFPQEALDQKFGQFPRNPTIERCSAPNQYPNSANGRLGAYGLKQSTYDLFSYDTFTEFAVQGRMTLEAMHNTIHYEASCQGQFLDASVSAFDALFMLHHTQVDRLWAYWQFINPGESTFKDPYNGFSRFTTPQGTLITPNSPLAPFYDTNNQFYTPNSVLSIRKMGYTYEGLEYWNKTDDQLHDDATQLITSLYEPSQTQDKRSVAGAHTRYFVNVELDRTQLERPCSINLFIKGKHAGTVPVMQLPETGTVTAGLAIDDILDGAFKTLLTGNLLATTKPLVEAQISKPDGTVIPLSSVESLKITVEEVFVTPAKTKVGFPKMNGKKKHFAKFMALSLKY